MTTALQKHEPQGELARPLPTPADMLQGIIEKGVTTENVAALEKIVGLYERMQEAQRLGIVESAVAMRLMRGFYPDLNIRRINGRARFVTPAINLPITFTPEKEAASASVKIGPPNDTGPNNRESRKSIGAEMPMDAISRRPRGLEHDTAILSRAMKAVQGRRRGVRQIP